MFDYRPLKEIVEIEFYDIVKAVRIFDSRKMRLFIIEGSYVDIFLSVKSSKKKYAYHWERVMIDNSFYRQDNIPDGNWSKIKTFPKHFHNGRYSNVEESYISDEPSKAIREFLVFVKKRLKRGVT